MRPAAIVNALAAAGLIIGSACTHPAWAAEPYCPNSAHAQPAPTPAHLLAQLARAFGVDVTAVRGASYVRCVGATLMGCYVGANLICDQADTLHTNPGASAWCRSHPGSADIPMAATGHATIYEWTCDGDRAIAGKIVTPVDADGYMADNWKELR